MKKYLRFLLVFVATISVTGLGYYAYTLASTTLGFMFSGESSQYGKQITVAFNPPWISKNSITGSIDSNILIQSIERNNKPWNPTVSGEGSFFASGNLIQIIPQTMSEGESLKINSEFYNDHTPDNSWKIPRDITLNFSQKTTSIAIKQTGLQKDLQYEVATYGFDELGPDDVQWYIQEDFEESNGCNTYALREGNWRKISVSEKQEHISGQKKSGIYTMNLKSYPTKSCIVAGLGGEHYFLYFPELEPFTATGYFLEMLSPEYDMQSRFEFDMSSDIFTDTGSLYSKLYLDNRQDAKINFLKHLSVTPDILVTEDMIELTPKKAILNLNLQEGKEYTISLDNIEDLYGRSASIKKSFLIEKSPMLSMRIAGNKTVIPFGSTIPAKLYQSQGKKNEYDIKLCKMTLEGYSEAERIIEVGKKEHTESLYKLLSGSGAQNCYKKTVVFSSGSSIAQFDISKFVNTVLQTGLYVIAFAQKEDISNFEKFVSPRVFSIIDTHLTLKVDAGGQVSVLATDIKTGEPRPGQMIHLEKNISELYTQNWNPTTEKYEYTYKPINNPGWNIGSTIGTTAKDGTLKKEKITIDSDNPYGLTSEGGDYNGRYDSFVAFAVGNGHFGYVVSTWNDGITGWNFGLKESDYGWSQHAPYMSYIHTDRKLYLPGETVYIKAIVRKNTSMLAIPENEDFMLTVNDPEGKIFTTKQIRANSFGSLSTNIVIPKDGKLGSYSINIVPLNDSSVWIENSYTNFQVEVFKNPTFTTEVTLSSPEIKENVIENVREYENDTGENTWYDKVYKSNFTINGIVKAHYYNGSQIKSTPFSYRVYRNPHYDASDWGDCFWGCYWEPAPEFYSEGTGSIDSDGFGLFRVGIDFSTYSDDYIYTAEITLADPITGETVTTPGTLLVELPEKYKSYDAYNPLESILSKKILNPGENIDMTMKPKYGKWKPSMKGKYKYEIVQRTYIGEKVSGLRPDQGKIIHSSESLIEAHVVEKESISIKTQGKEPGEYFVRIFPNTPKKEGENTEPFSETLFFITGNFQNKDNALRVIPEKTVYHKGETAKVLITTPFSHGGHAYITRERGGIIDHEYISFSGSNMSKEYTIDETFYPNTYIGVVAFPNGDTESRLYAVGYGEIIMDLKEKKGNLTITSNQEIYKNGETVKLSLNLENHKKEGQIGEVEIMVVDESLIRLLGNIDLDIIPRFFQKYPFTMKTALTAIGMEQNRFLSRKGSNGGSGDKGGGGGAISSRTLFKNTAYYNPSIVTDKNGNASVSFKLPDNVTDYRIIAIGQTKDSQFSVSEKTISVRRDYTLEVHGPDMVYPGDSTTITASIFNSTTHVTSATISIAFGTGGSLGKQSEDIISNPGEVIGKDFPITIDKSWSGAIPYTVSITEKGKSLDSITKTIHINTIPLLQDMSRISGVTFSGILLDSPPQDPNTNKDSEVSISLSTSPLQNPEKIITSLITYPYGCIEQTLSSTLPNAIALKMASQLGITIDTKVAQEHLTSGINKILRMQDSSGYWKYWETDTSTNTHVTPYVLRSLLEFQSLGVNIPQDTLKSGLDAIANSEFDTQDLDANAEVFATLALAHDQRSETKKILINPEKLSRHGYLMYMIGMQSIGKFDEGNQKKLEKRMANQENTPYWYWDTSADDAIYARLLLKIGKKNEAGNRIVNLLKKADPEGYYTSTQTKLQLFLALVEMNNIGKLPPYQIETGNLKINPKAISNTQRYTYTTRRGLIGKTISILGGSPNTPLYYDIRFYDTPIDIYAMKSVHHPDISVNRVFEKIDESKGIDQYGQFISATPIKNNTFTRGALYRVRVTIHQKKFQGNKYYLTLEDYIPGGWRPIRGIFQTESSSTPDPSSEYGYFNGWTYAETRTDRILATQNWIYQSDYPYTYTYYIRPEYRGTYLLPPVTAYYMYEPDIHALGTYEKIRVQ